MIRGQPAAAPEGPAIGLVAGNGRLPLLFSRSARAQGLRIVAVAHVGETEPELEAEVDALTWVRLGQVNRILRVLTRAGVARAVLAGGIGRVTALTRARPDLGGLRILAGLTSLRDDALLRSIAAHFERAGVSIVAPTDFLREAFAPEGEIAGPSLSAAERKDLALGVEVATALGRADVGQTVVIRAGHVLALEAIEGTDEAIRRGGRLGGRGAVVVKLCKPGQDERFDLPAVGVRTLVAMGEVGARVLAVEAGRAILLEAGTLVGEAARRGISLVGVSPSRHRG